MSPAELERYLHDHIPLSRAMAVGVVSADDHPILGDFTARAQLQQADAWGLFTRMLARKGKARIAVQSVLQQGGAGGGPADR